VAALGALVIAAVVLAVVLLGGDGTTPYKIRFQNAGQLVKGDDIQVGGVRVGSIEGIELTDNNQAEVEVELDNEYAPLHEGTVAVIRATSLSGIANRYIALTIGPNNAPELADGATLSSEKTTSIVDLDQLFDTFDPRTRRALQQFIQGNARWYAGKGPQANASAKYFAPYLSTTDAVVNQLLKDQGAFTNFLVESEKVVTTLASRRDELADLVTNANTAAGAVASEASSLDQALGLLPGTLRKANSTFVNLRATLDDLDPLVAASKPATKDLARFLSELRPLVANAQPTFEDLALLVNKSGADNDLTDATKLFPQLASLAGPAFTNSITALKKAQPVLEFARPYTPELINWFRDFGQGAAPYDANGHYARVQPIFSNYTLGPGNVLNAIAPSARFDGWQKGVVKRCPGTASQAPADGSAPFLDDGNLGASDCDPTLIPPGP
jgi:phospholipid/cholesterol/gamma-HCH transport system substrate-binding protein